MANQIGEQFTATLNAGDTVNFLQTLNAAKYTFKCGGTADVVVGVYNKDQPVGTDGLLKIAGVAKWGCRSVPTKGVHIITIKAVSAGTFTLTATPYSYWDEIGLRFTHKSS